MKLSLSTVLLSAIACCHASDDEADQGQRREELSQPGFGLDNAAPLPAQENTFEGDWDHVPFESRIVGGTVASGDTYPFHVDLGGCGDSLYVSFFFTCDVFVDKGYHHL